MKKFTITILAGLYLLVTSGVAINFHYCMDELRSIDFDYTQTEKCDKCGMSTKKSGCCKDATQWYKVSDNHQTAHVDLVFQASVIDLAHPQPFTELEVPFATTLINAHGGPSPPLLHSGTDLNVLHCVFRI